ncbi:MAG: hypothetical protein PHQ85_06325 [Eubacteriales bacterium]|jgi:hypothetical protein|nr:hypothetical protein [Eubacteriales bacterium]MDD4710877.1 hypothetical protein [Eubacteriales bacterium]
MKIIGGALVLLFIMKPVDEGDGTDATCTKQICTRPRESLGDIAVRQGEGHAIPPKHRYNGGEKTAL